MNIKRSLAFGIGLAIALGLSACDESPVDTGGAGDNGGPDTVTYVDEGSPASPLDITGLTPYDGQVAKDSYSYYRITGVTPEEVHTITLALSDGLPYQIVPNAAPNGGGIACGWANETPGAVIDCAMRSTPGGVLDFSVNGDDSIGGAYVITFTQGGVVNEGSPGDPVEVDTFPFSGGALVQSYYLLVGLTPGNAYVMEFAAASGPVGLFVYPDGTYQQKPNICSTLDDSGKSCNVAADASGHIYLMTNAQQHQYGVMYTIAVTEAGVADEGSVYAPIDITTRLPYSGMVHLGSSWYIVSGLTPGSPYTVTLSNASDSANLYVWGPGFDVGRYDCYHWWNNGGGDPIDCVSVADDNGDIRIEVRGFDTTDGATFDLDMTPGGIPNEGYYGNPVDITGHTPWFGSLYKDSSYYKITGMAAGTDYTITVTSPTDDVMLFVYDAGDNPTHLCSSNEPGTADEACGAQTSTGEFHIRVAAAHGSVRGATYTLNVTP